MRKEVIFAILIGLLLGSVILYGVQLANSSARKAADLPLSPTLVVNPSATPTSTQTKNKLALSQPENHAVVDTAIITVTGKTIPGSNISLHNSEDDTLTTTDASGNFSATLKLVGGENIIEVTALTPDKNLEETTLTIIYTTAKLD